MVSRKEEIINERNKARKIVLRKIEAKRRFKEKYNFKRNAHSLADFSDQRTGKTTFYIIYCLINYFITICYLPKHEKSFEIWTDTFKSYVSKKIRKNFRIVNMIGKDKKRSENIKTMQMLEFPEYGETDYLCAAYKHSEERIQMTDEHSAERQRNPAKKIIELRKSNNLPDGFCRRVKKEGEGSDTICPYRQECYSIRQLDKIIKKIKGDELFKLERKSNKSQKDIERIKELIKISKQTHWLILLPHAYLGNTYNNKLFEAFEGDHYKEKEIATIIDESVFNMSLTRLELNRQSIIRIIKFFQLRPQFIQDEDLFGMYNAFKDFLNILKINTGYSQAEFNERRVLNNRQKAEYDKRIIEVKINNVWNYLREFKEKFTIFELLILNNNYKLSLKKYSFKPPYNMFNKLIDIMREIIKIDNENFDKVKERMVIKLQGNWFIYPRNDKTKYTYNIDRSVITIFADATGTKEKYNSLMSYKYRINISFIERINIFNSKVRCLYDQSTAKKYQFFDSNHTFINNNKFKKHIQRTASLIYYYTIIRNKKKIMLALSKEFNDGKKGRQKWEGRMMKELMIELHRTYRIDFRNLNIKLGFFYAEAGLSRFDDRDCLIFFNMPGVPAELTRMITLFLNILKYIVDEHYQDKEQEQMAGRITNFNSLIPKEVCFLAGVDELSRYFDHRRPVKGMDNTLTYYKLIKHLHEHGELTTLEIKNQLYPGRPINSVRYTLDSIFNENFLLDRSEISSNAGVTEYIWFLKNS